VTTPRERREEFFENCLHRDDDERVGAVRIDTPAERNERAERYWNQADFHRKAAADNLAGEAALMAIRQGYYVMLHKSNQALALAGFEPKTHRCTLLGVRGIFDAPDLADDLRRASAERNNVDYAMNPADPELQEFDAPRTFLSDTVSPFVETLDGVVASELDLSEDAWATGPTMD
jgi:uncharacterized protein (UPF0332 family)